MIRSTLFKNIARALRDSLNDAEVSALGLWLLMSAGAYPLRVATYNKDDANLEEMERHLVDYVYPDGTSTEVALVQGSFSPDARFIIANRGTVAQAVENARQLLETIAESNEARVVQEAPPMPQPAPDRDLTWHAQPFRERNPVADIPEPGRLHVPPVQIRNFNVQAEQAARANMPRFTIDPDQARVFPEDAAQEEQDALAMQVGAAAEEHARQMIDWMQRQRVVDQAHVDALANRTRGIPNRR